jgi:hypothetical protein
MSKMMTVADVTDADLELFSDMYKECYDMRPRFTPTKEDFVDLANRYDDIQADRLEEDRLLLERASAELGYNVDSLQAYYDARQAQAERAFAERLVARLEAAAIVKPGIKQVIDRWEHGDI